MQLSTLLLLIVSIVSSLLPPIRPSTLSDLLVLLDPIDVHCGGEASVNVSKFVVCPDDGDAPSLPMECRRGDVVFPQSGQLQFDIPIGMADNSTIVIRDGGDEFKDETGTVRRLDAEIMVKWRRRKKVKRDPSESVESPSHSSLSLESPSVEWFIDSSDNLVMVVPITLRESLMGFERVLQPFHQCDDTLIHVTATGVTDPLCEVEAKMAGMRTMKRRDIVEKGDDGSASGGECPSVTIAFDPLSLPSARVESMWPFTSYLSFLASLFDSTEDYPTRGDLKIMFQVEFPSDLTSEEKQKVREMLREE